jgi:allantoin racemase
MVINPNTTGSLTKKIEVSARAVAHPTTEIIALNPDKGPASIEGHYDGAYAVPGMLELVRKGETEGYNGYVIACFDDTGLDAAREVARSPVIGICEAAMYTAALLGTSFSVVTTLPRSIPIIEHLAVKYGMERFCRQVRSAEIPVLALETPGSDAAYKVKDEVKKAIAQDRAECILLGCAGMSDLAKWLSSETGVPVIDGVAAAVKLVEALVGLGISTSKIGGYGFPLPKTYRGDFACFQLE